MNGIQMHHKNQKGIHNYQIRPSNIFIFTIQSSHQCERKSAQFFPLDLSKTFGLINLYCVIKMVI